jgi:polyisoprenoid-binding protein YceI
MFRKIAIALGVSSLLVSASGQTAGAKTYNIDADHTAIVFRVNHLGFSNVFGRFKEFAGALDFDGEWSGGKVELTIQTGSLDTAVAKRDDHLRSPDFFNAAEFPTMKFVSTGIEKNNDNTGTLKGDLTLLGVTKPVTLDVTFNKVGPHPDPRMAGVEVAGFSAKTVVKRSEFGMKTFLPGVSDDIEIWLEVEGQHK